MIEAAIGEPPFAFLDDASVRENLISGEIQEKPDEINADVWELVVSMTTFDPSKRVPLKHVLEKLEVLAQDEHDGKAQAGENRRGESATLQLQQSHLRLSQLDLTTQAKSLIWTVVHSDGSLD